MPGASIAIAGGGLIGMSIAWRLAQLNFAVTVFDQGTVGGEASWAGAGMLAPGGEVDGPSDFAALAIESRGLYLSFVRELAESSRTAIDYQECGALDLAYGLDEWTELQAKAQRQISFGIVAKKLEQGQVQTFWPRVRSEGLSGAYFYPNDAIVNPRELIAALTSACGQHGVRVLPKTAVTAAEVGEECVRVESSGAAAGFDAMIVAAGAWSSSIRVANVEPLPLCEPVKGHLVGFQQPDQTCNTILRRGHTYLLQRANGLLIAGASVENAGWDRTVDPRIAASLATDAEFILPHLAETTPSEIWTGFRPASRQLHVGRWHSPRLYLAYGHYRNGILLGPVTARNIAREITASLKKQ